MVELLDKIRAFGWHVANHYDYEIGNCWFTFYLFTNGNGRYVKGENTTDCEALEQCLKQIETMRVVNE